MRKKAETPGDPEAKASEVRRRKKTMTKKTIRKSPAN